MKTREKDLFGYIKNTRRPRLETAVLKHDRETLDARLERLRHLQTIFPRGYGFLSGVETALVFDEAKMAYINGLFVATILLSQAHIEHALQGYPFSSRMVRVKSAKAASSSRSRIFLRGAGSVAPSRTWVFSTTGT
jgi:hypothetical protein